MSLLLRFLLRICFAFPLEELADSGVFPLGVDAADSIITLRVPPFIARSAELAVRKSCGDTSIGLSNDDHHSISPDN